MELYFKGKRITLKAGKIDMPDGRRTYKEIIYHPGAVVILAVKDNKILLIKQYRAPINKWIIELPAGTLEENEDPSITAQRELLEETGYYPKKINKLIEFYSSPGISNEVLHAYIAEELIEKTPEREEDELIENMWVTIDEALQLIKNNEIQDAKTIITILYYAMFYSQGNPL